MPMNVVSGAWWLMAAEEGAGKAAPPARTLLGSWDALAALFTLDLLWKAVVFSAVLAAAAVVGNLVSRAVGAMLTRGANKPNQLLTAFMVGWTKRFFILLGLVMAVHNLGVNVVTLIAGLGVAGIVVGLAVQGALSNLVSGVMLMFYQPFDIGDLIEAKDVKGRVSAMTMANTILNTLDYRQVTIPNTEVWNSVIVNYTRNPTRRVDLLIAVSYAADLDRTLALIRALVVAHPKVLADPAPVIEVDSWDDSAINLAVYPFVATPDYLQVKFDLHRTIKQLFDANGIEIPFPQRTLHLAPATIAALKGQGQEREPVALGSAAHGPGAGAAGPDPDGDGRGRSDMAR